VTAISDGIGKLNENGAISEFIIYLGIYLRLGIYFFNVFEFDIIK